jgi:hypothetical protein
MSSSKFMTRLIVHSSGCNVHKRLDTFVFSSTLEILYQIQKTVVSEILI